MSIHISTKRIWSTQDVRDLVQNKFRKRACYFQIKVAQALYTGKDVVACAPTGAGKTLTFWIPILMALEEGKSKMSIVVTPLNLPGKQNKEALDKAGINGVAISRHNAIPQTFKVCPLPTGFCNEYQFDCCML
jgi:superfamily II DNA helicase RecQ